MTIEILPVSALSLFPVLSRFFYPILPQISTVSTQSPAPDPLRFHHSVVDSDSLCTLFKSRALSLIFCQNSVIFLYRLLCLCHSLQIVYSLSLSLTRFSSKFQVHFLYRVLPDPWPDGARRPTTTTTSKDHDDPPPPPLKTAES